MNKKYFYIGMVLLAAAVIGAGFTVTKKMFFKTGGAEAAAVYYCPMHPDFRSDKPGECGICGMDLVKAEPSPDLPVSKKERKVLYYRNPMDPKVMSHEPMKDSMGMDYVPVYEEESAPTGQEGVYISPERQQLIGVAAEEARYRNLTRIIRAAGKIAYDPDLYNAQVEYLEALRAGEKAVNSAIPEIASNSKALISSARLRLTLLGLGNEQIKELERKNEVSENLLLGEPGRSLWMYAEVYEYESGMVKTGQAVDVYSKAFPDKIFNGAVRSIASVLNPDTRTVRVRVELDNPGSLLKPEMFVNADIKVNLGNVLSVPKEAVMDTGTEQLVFIDRGDGYFSAKKVKLGRPADDYYEIVSGLRPGERVVTSANFLVDSESRLKSALKQLK